MIRIIGGSGFVGTRLAQRLRREGIEFRVVDKVPSDEFGEQSIIADVRDKDMLRDSIERGDIVVNLAAEHRDDVTPRSLYDAVNVMGAKNVCAVATEKEVRTIVFTSSVAVYGFAPIGTDEEGEIRFYNDYGRTKYEAEQVYRSWQAEDAANRTLFVVRPTVVFGEQNRGNVYNLLKQIMSGSFVMVGNGLNRKSLAYVENVAAFLQFGLDFPAGVHTYNYVDKPDFDMNSLIAVVYKAVGKKGSIGIRLPFFVGYLAGKVFDVVAAISGKHFAISSIRVKKFCANSMFDTSVAKTGFVPPVGLVEGLMRTIQFEFIDKRKGHLFYSE